MARSLFVTRRRRPTLGAVYVAAVGALAILLLALIGAGLASPVAVIIVAVPLGPIGVIAAALALPGLGVVPSLPAAMLVVATVLAIAAVNVMLAAAASFVARARLDRGGEHLLVR